MKRPIMFAMMWASVAWGQDSVSTQRSVETDVTRYSQASLRGPASDSGRIGISLGALINNTAGVLPNLAGVLPSLRINYARGLTSRLAARGQALLSSNFGSVEAGASYQLVDWYVDFGVHAALGSFFSLLTTPPPDRRFNAFSASPYVAVGLGPSVAWSRLTLSFLLDALVVVPQLTGAKIIGDSRSTTPGFRAALVFDIRLGRALTTFISFDLMQLVAPAGGYVQLGANVGVGW
jgi:hypothetical protein